MFYIYIYINDFAVHPKLAQYCKSTRSIKKKQALLVHRFYIKASVKINSVGKIQMNKGKSIFSN